MKNEHKHIYASRLGPLMSIHHTGLPQVSGILSTASRWTYECVITGQSWRSCVFVSGGISTTDPPANPSTWLADKLWGEMVRLDESFPYPFKGLAEDFTREQEKFKVILVE